MRPKMKHIILCLSTWLSALTLSAQECPDLISPANGSTGVAVDQIIDWELVPGIPGYRILLGTTPGGSELVEQSVGSATFYVPPLGLPENTTIYVTIVLDFLFEAGEDIICTGQSFTTGSVTAPPSCNTIDYPSDGAEEISVFSSIRWSYTPTASGYNLLVGTTPGGGDIFDGDVGNVLSFNPPGDFPPTTTLYVQLQPYNSMGAAVGPCTTTSFQTGIIQAIPGCSYLISPLDGAINVPLTSRLEWASVANADGYRVTIGDTPYNANVLDDVALESTSVVLVDFLPNSVYFIRIIPFNTSGEAVGCRQESFSTSVGCGPYFDPNVGEYVTLSPEINFPDSISFCENESPYVFTSEDVADGYRWYRLDEFGNEDLLSESNEVSLDETGFYRYEAYNLVDQLGEITECISSKEFEVVSSESADISGLGVTQGADGLDIVINVSGIGSYEYAIGNPDGPYQEDNAFYGLPLDTYTFYVRDKNGCGISQVIYTPGVPPDGFPAFFTPNGDGINDFWQYIPPENAKEPLVDAIMIFDRLGTFLAQINPTGLGWDGTFMGRPLPANTYWFKAMNGDQKPVVGYFALKR